MQININVSGIHHGKPLEINTEVNVTPAEMIEIYQSAPGIVKEFRTMMREDKLEKAMAKAKRNMKTQRKQNV